MPLLSPEGQTLVSDIASRHGFSEDAVTHMLIAVNNGAGTQAQFNHWEFGGMGQWSMGGMIMIGDMFNNGLKARVDSLCCDLSGALASAQVFQPAPRPTSFQGQSQSGGGMQMQSNGGMGGGSSLFVSGGGFGGGFGTWWPEELGQPGSTGAQNDLKYAYFPGIARLAILLNGQVTVYDTGQHQIGGFGQQQGGDQSLTFTSQFGLVRVADLPVVSPGGQARRDPAPTPEPAPQQHMDPAPAAPVPPAAQSGGDSDAIFAALEKLGQLRDMGVLTDAEFDAKKAELLARL